MESTTIQPVNMVDLRSIYIDIIRHKKGCIYPHGLITISPEEMVINSMNLVRIVYFGKIELIKKFKYSPGVSLSMDLIVICMLNDDTKMLDEVVKICSKNNELLLTLEYELYEKAITIDGKVPCIKVIKWLLVEYPPRVLSRDIITTIKCDKYEIFDILFEYVMKTHDMKNEIIEVCRGCILHRNPYFINKFSNHNLMTVDWMLKVLGDELNINYFEQYKQILLLSKFDSISLTNGLLSNIIEPSARTRITCMKLIKYVYWEKVGRYLHLWDILKYPDITKHISNMFFFDYMMYIRFCTRHVVKRKLPICYDIDSSDELVVFY